MKNVIEINSADFKFTDFSESIVSTTEHHNRDWFIKLREVDARIHREQLQDKITFSDDRLVLIAYKAMAETGIFDNKAKLREWWIVWKYFQLYVQDKVEGVVELRKLTNMYIGFKFTGAEQDKASEKEFDTLKKKLSKIVYEDGYMMIPQFVLDVIEGVKTEIEEILADDLDHILEGSISELMKRSGLPKKEVVGWVENTKTAKMILSTPEELSEEEISAWEQFIEAGKLMLNINS